MALEVAASPDLSIVIPLTDARGDAAEHLRTWTHGQTCARSRYEVVIVSDGSEPEVDRDVSALLEPHDRFEVAAGAGIIELWNRAVELANGDWLLFTENHVRAEPDCIEKALAGIRANPSLDAASIDHGHIAPEVTGELGARWFDDVYSEWFQPEQWRRLNLAGFVIRPDALRSAGGHDHRLGLFAAPLLSARLDAAGAEVGHLPEARILHIQCEEIEEHHEHSADYLTGESEARTSLPPEFAERYFGYRSLFWNRRGMGPKEARRRTLLVARQIPRALRRRRADVRWLLRSLAGRLPEALAGVRLRRRLAELTFRWTERTADSSWLPRGVRYRAYLRAQDRVVRLAELSWIEQRIDEARPALAPGDHPAESIPEGAMVGVHGLEAHGGRQFRWSEPVLSIRIDSPRSGQLRIGTEGLRGSPLGCVAAAYLGARRLPPDRLGEEGTDLVIELPGGTSDLTVLCRPLDAGTAEKRELGLPIFSVRLGELSPPPRPAKARAPAALA